MRTEIWDKGLGFLKLALNDNKRNSVLALVLIGALMVDTMLSNISDILSSQLNTVGGVLLFGVLVAIIFGSSHYLLIYFEECKLRTKVQETSS